MNMNVRKRLQSISVDLAEVREHVAQHSGVDRSDALFLDNLIASMIEDAAMIAAEARTTAGNKSGAGLVQRIRKALGFTQP
jgi:hypothetical protein